MAAYARIYASAADAKSIANGANHAIARQATPATTTTEAAAVVGQNTSFNCFQYFPVFDTSAVPAGAGVAELSMSVSPGPNPAGDTFELREVSSITNGIAGDSLASHTLLGSVVPTTETARSFRLRIADISGMSRSASCKLLLHSQRQRLAVAPSTAETVSFNTADQTGTVNDPYLTVLGSAWSIVGIGAVAETTSTTLPLVEPGGVADGDLLIACIASRTTATAAIGNTGWTAVGSQNNNNTLATTSALASGTMLYQVRAGAPDLSFTLPAGISVALGRIVAYRGNAAATPLDAATAVTTATNTTPVSVAGLTTTEANDLIVAMAAGGQEATWLAFNATVPSGASGSPTPYDSPSTTWTERADSSTTTGVDTSLGIFDAVKETAGATGNLTVTASLGAGHVVIAGAFKIAAAAVGEFTGTGTATLAASAAASGVEGQAGTAAAVVNVSASASGTHASAVTGTAAATLAASSSASGVEGVAGTAGATIALSGAGSGAQAASGTAAATLALSVAASGAFLGEVTGTAAATLAIAAAASGEFEEEVEPVTGTGEAVLALSGAGIGVEGVAGTASATLSLSIAAIGEHVAEVTGAAAATLALSAEATDGEAPVTGTADVVLGPSAEADGSFTAPVEVILPGGGGHWTWIEPVKPKPVFGKAAVRLALVAEAEGTHVALNPVTMDNDLLLLAA